MSNAEEFMSTVPRINGISDFVDYYLGYAEGTDLSSAGPHCQQLADAIGSEAANPLIATTFWQAYLRSPAFERVIDEYELSTRLASRREFMVVAHPLVDELRPRYDLLVLDPEVPPNDPIPLDVDVTPEELHVGWFRLHDDLQECESLNSDSPAAKCAEHFEIVAEAHGAEQFRVLLAALPRVTETSAPSPAWIVRQSTDAPSYATVGIIDRNRDDVLGATVPHHLLAQEPALPVPLGMPVSIDLGEQGLSLVGVVISSHPQSDSCFVELPVVEPVEGIASFSPTYVSVQQTRPVRLEPVTELLAGVFPRQGDEAVFDGALSKRTAVRITAWNPDLLSISPFNMCKFFTEPKTGSGDSGAALRDVLGRLLGFAFGRTEYDETPEYSSWIWAESVAAAHGLSITTRATHGTRASAASTPASEPPTPQHSQPRS
jgi:hypothetical protein